MKNVGRRIDDAKCISYYLPHIFKKIKMLLLNSDFLNGRATSHQKKQTT